MLTGPADIVAKLSEGNLGRKSISSTVPGDTLGNGIPAARFKIRVPLSIWPQGRALKRGARLMHTQLLRDHLISSPGLPRLTLIPVVLLAIDALG